MNTISKAFVIIFLTSVLNAGEWHVNKDKKNQVTFISSTTLLDFEGTTENVDGYIFWEGDSLFSADNKIYFELPLTTFDTGIGKRDRDMREDVLETDKYPFAIYKGSVIELYQTENQYELTVTGTMSLHGKERDLTIKAIALLSEDQLHVTSTFSILLKDYDIEAPSLLAFVKVAEEIQIKVNLTMMKIN